MSSWKRQFPGAQRPAYHGLQLVSGEQRKEGDGHDAGHPLANGSHLLVKFMESGRKSSLCISTQVRPHRHLGVCFTDGAAQPEFTRRAQRGPPRKLRQHTIRDRARCPLPVPPEPQTRSIRPSWRPHGRALCKRAVPRPHCWRVWAPGGNGRRDSTARDTPRTTLPPSPASEARPALGASSQHRPGASGGEALRNLLRERGMSGGAAAGWLTCHTATAPQCWHEGHRGAA